MIKQILLIIVLIILIVLILIIFKYFPSKLQEAVSKAPDPKKPLAHLPRWKRILVFVPLAAVLVYSTYLEIKNENARYQFKQEQKKQLIEGFYKR